MKSWGGGDAPLRRRQRHAGPAGEGSARAAPASSACSPPTPWGTASRSTPTNCAIQATKVLHHLRQQSEKQGFPNYCLADYVAPKRVASPTGLVPSR
ncbi:vitamin B12 dependent-methionine synthase activation domain-containing protein [Escherichia coli]